MVVGEGYQLRRVRIDADILSSCDINKYDNNKCNCIVYQYKQYNARYNMIENIPSTFTCFGSVNVRKFTETEPANARWISVAVNSHRPAAGGRFERLTDLLVQLEIGNSAPVFRLYDKDNRER